MRSYAMRGAVPVLLTAHLIKLSVTRQVSTLNPALRIPPPFVNKCRRTFYSNLGIFILLNNFGKNHRNDYRKD